MTTNVSTGGRVRAIIGCGLILFNLLGMDFAAHAASRRNSAFLGGDDADDGDDDGNGQSGPSGSNPGEPSGGTLEDPSDDPPNPPPPVGPGFGPGTNPTGQGGGFVDPFAQTRIVGVGTSGASLGDDVAEIKVSPDDPTRGVGDFTKQGLADFLHDMKELPDSKRDEAVNAALNGEIAAYVPVQWDATKNAWNYYGEQVQFYDPTSSRPPLPGLGSDGVLTGADSTLKYQQGPLMPDITTSTPAVDRGVGQSGESITPSTGNSLNGNSSGDTRNQGNQNPHGLPGLGKDGKTTDADRQPPKTWQDYATKLDHYSEDTTARIQKTNDAFGVDVDHVSGQVDAASLGLQGTIDDTRTKHNQTLTGLDQKAGVSTGSSTQIPMNPPLEPSSGAPVPPDHFDWYHFKTPRDSDEGRQLETAQHYRDHVSASPSNIPGPQRESLIRAADKGLELADQAFVSGDLGSAAFAMDLTMKALDAVTGLTGTTDSANTYKALTGFDPTTDLKLPPYVRGLAMAATAIAIDTEIAILAPEMVVALGVGIGIIGGVVAIDEISNSLTVATSDQIQDEDNSERSSPSTPGQRGQIETGNGIDLKDSSTWPEPPGTGPFREGEPSRSKPRSRGEKSLYDRDGGEWRPHVPDSHHSDGHWDYKPAGNNQQWLNIYP